MTSWTSRLASWLAPPPGFMNPTAPEARSSWVPPALSAAATAPPATITAASHAPAAPEWQERAWEHYRCCGEARRAVNWIANSLSRCHLFIGSIDPDGAGDPEPVDEPGIAGDILDELHDGPTGQAAMMRRLAVHLLVPGESWLIGYPAPPDPVRDDQDDGEARTAWVVASRKEWAVDSEDAIRLKLPEHPQRDETGWVVFPASSVVVVRVHDPDPEDYDRPTSDFEAAQSALEELDGLDRRVQADINSRLASAGVFEMPESAMMPMPEQAEGVNPSNGSPLVQGLLATASTAIQDPDSPSAVVPIVITTSDEAAGKSRHVTFATPFDAQVPVLREDSRKRLAAVMDIPASIVTGVEDLNHWSAWQVSDDAVRSHLGPLAALICNTLTSKILWPAMRAAGEPVEKIRELAIWWDASEIVLRPDRSTEALEAHKQKVIGGHAVRRELGFSEDDAPSPAELAPPVPLGPDGRPIPPDPQQDPQQGGQASPSQRPEPPQGDRGAGGPRVPATARPTAPK